MMPNYRVTIGRNIGSEPMGDEAWERFRDDVHYLLIEHHATIFLAATGSGVWIDSDGRTINEDSATWSFSTNLPLPLGLALVELRDRFGQDAIEYSPVTVTFV